MLAAFPFPLAQGSQLLVRDQLRALRAAGAEVTLFCYGSGDGEAPADLDIVRIPRALSPRALRAGPGAGKPFADAALAAGFAAAQRRRRFRAVLAHNAEAALAALAASKLAPLPVVYVAHTLLGAELDAYVPPALAGAARRLGAALDRGIAARADAVVALCRSAAEALSPHARGPLEILPPGLDPRPAPDPASRGAVCARLGVTPGRFALYTGNVDRYQDLEELAEAAQRMPGLPLLLATHGERRFARPGLASVRVSPEEARALTFACGVAVLPRRRLGGFPIKLLTYMEAGRAIVARTGVADGLEHDRSAWLLDDRDGAAELGEALRRLLDDPARAERLGARARATLERRHAWPDLARRTLALVEQLPKPSR